jgi:hypothetical protein
MDSTERSARPGQTGQMMGLREGRCPVIMDIRYGQVIYIKRCHERCEADRITGKYLQGLKIINFLLNC